MNGLKSEGSTQKFSYYLNTHIFDKVSFKEIHLIDPIADTTQEKIKKYSELLKKDPLDIALNYIFEGR